MESCSLLDESEASSKKTEKNLFWKYRFPYCWNSLNDLPDLYCLGVLQRF